MPLKRFLEFSWSFITGLKPVVNESKDSKTFEEKQVETDEKPPSSSFRDLFDNFFN